MRSLTGSPPFTDWTSLRSRVFSFSSSMRRKTVEESGYEIAFTAENLVAIVFSLGLQYLVGNFFLFCCDLAARQNVYWVVKNGKTYRGTRPRTNAL